MPNYLHGCELFFLKCARFSFRQNLKFYVKYAMATAAANDCALLESNRGVSHKILKSLETKSGNDAVDKKSLPKSSLDAALDGIIN